MFTEPVSDFAYIPSIDAVRTRIARTQSERTPPSRPLLLGHRSPRPLTCHTHCITRGTRTLTSAHLRTSTRD